jgi:hypothetical protein
MIAGLGAISLVVILGAAAVLSSSGGAPRASSNPSGVALATPAATTQAATTPAETTPAETTPAPTRAATSTPRITPTPVPTAVPTEEGMPWDVFYAYQATAQDQRVADNNAWNAANTSAKTAAVVATSKAHAQADLAWLQANTPRQCYTILYGDLVLYDNLQLTVMNDWLAGRYTAINKVDLPAVNAVWNRLDGEFSDAKYACS